jgi:hypothetical protein
MKGLYDEMWKTYITLDQFKRDLGSLRMLEEGFEIPMLKGEEDTNDPDCKIEPEKWTDNMIRQGLEILGYVWLIERNKDLVIISQNLPLWMESCANTSIESNQVSKTQNIIKKLQNTIEMKQLIYEESQHDPPVARIDLGKNQVRIEKEQLAS